MKEEDIKSTIDAHRYCEGVLNDLVEGIITKDEAFQYLGEYTIRILELHKISLRNELKSRVKNDFSKYWHDDTIQDILK